MEDLKPAPAGFTDLVPDDPIDTRVAFTGCGLVTPLGTDARSTWNALLAGQWIRDHATVPLARQAGISRVSQLAIRAAREAIAQAGWSPAVFADDRTALVIGTSKGPVEAWLNAPPEHMLNEPYVSVGRSDTFGLAQISREIAAAFQLGRGPRLTLSAACASGLHALIRGAMLIHSGDARRVLVVAAEASVHPLFLASFKRLRLLPADGIGCRPFDLTRDGFLMSEAAAAVCLESEPPEQQIRPANGPPIPRIFLQRFALGADATHLTGSDPAGETLRRCLAQVIAGQHIDLIHAHGTGTQTNDPIELAAIESVLAVQNPPAVVYSHKGALGHSLGASGLVSVVLNLLMHRLGRIPANINTSNPLPVTRVILPRQPINRPIHRSLAAAAGFGGAVAAVSLASL